MHVCMHVCFSRPVTVLCVCSYVRARARVCDHCHKKCLYVIVYVGRATTSSHWTVWNSGK